MEDEEWKPVVGYEGRYEVSSTGLVKSLGRKDGAGRLRKGRLLRQVVKDSGHMRVALYDGSGNQKKLYVHTLVMEAFVGERPEGMEVCHNNGTPDDNRLENLRWDTRSENMIDVIRHGRNPQLNKTECPRGHALVAPNLRRYELTIGERKCLACRRAQGWLEKNGHMKKFMDEIADEYYKSIMGSA